MLQNFRRFSGQENVAAAKIDERDSEQKWHSILSYCTDFWTEISVSAFLFYGLTACIYVIIIIIIIIIIIVFYFHEAHDVLVQCRHMLNVSHVTAQFRVDPSLLIVAS
jgi:hypothetical protein